MVQLSRSGLTPPSQHDLDSLRAQFARQHCIRLPGLLDPDLLSFIRHRLETAEFAERAHDDIGAELCLTHDVALDLLHFLANDKKLFELVQQLTGCARIGCFIGRIYRMVPGSGHYDSWHSDTRDNRLIGLSLNLGTQCYDGGVFQLRERHSTDILCEVANTGAGDAILFRIARGLMHQVTSVEGTTPKTAFAGWFHARPEFLSLLTNGAGRSREEERTARGRVVDGRRALADGCQ
jgi:2-oxoglutarate-Fe(II)-dependent oxygenase superfamily protein